MNRFERQEDFVPGTRLQQTSVTVIGVGAVGRQLALGLAAIGVRDIQLIDFDHVESTNITTQGYVISDLNQPKVTATACAIQQIDETIQVTTILDRFRARQQMTPAVFCCVDSIAARSTIWKSIQERCEFWADARMRGEVLRVLVATDQAQRDYYNTTLFAQAEAHSGSCTSRSTIYTAGLCAGLLLHQFARWLRNLPTDRDLTLNLLASELVPH